MTREERAEALTAYVTAHPYRASAVPGVCSSVVILLATGLTGAWDDGVGLPFILAVLIPTCLVTWLGVGFFLRRVTERVQQDS